MNEKEIKKKLTKEEYHVLREEGTEAPHIGKYVDHFKDGSYRCKVCGNKLFESKTKYKSWSGWPSFTDAVKGSIKKSADFSYMMIRVKLSCAKCGSHLGHFFPDGPKLKRYCVNSLALDFKPKPSHSKRSKG
jgi:peptide-methionine (R)-S-oxide reductase